MKYIVLICCLFCLSSLARPQPPINIWIFNEQEVASFSPGIATTNLILISVQKGEYHSFNYSSKNRKKWETLLNSSLFNWISFDRKQQSFFPITLCPYSLVKKNNKTIAFIEWRLPSKDELEMQKRDLLLGLSSTLDFLRQRNVNYFVVVAGGTSGKELEPYVISLTQNSMINHIVVIPQTGGFEKELPKVVCVSECTDNIKILCIE